MDIVELWKPLPGDTRIHPIDTQVFERLGKNAHEFDLRCLPSPYWGPIRTARVVLLYLSPGLVQSDIDNANSVEEQAKYVRVRNGNAPLPGKQDPLFRWWTQRTKCFGDWRVLQEKVAVLNIGAYHSKRFADWQMLASLPSSRASLNWAQKVLFPEAISGERVVVCLRAAKFWGLGSGRHGEALFAPNTNRWGFMSVSEDRDLAIATVQSKLDLV